ncbi:hypothetical protein JKF63_00456 [Porcisia hertigi]|uniref:Uncharacterized protein n=1 Tax=Porcisia hertigi TaxID=2761500 RepID=A0A836HBN5_9TRYP|nr:hypothetical protein JKF63_00456 [Porcisia hertigi]
MAAMAVMLLVIVSTARGQSTVTTAPPRCDEDGFNYRDIADQTSTGVLLYDGLSFCKSGGNTSVVVAKSPAPPHSVVPLSGWSYLVGLNGPTVATFSLNAVCDDTVVCQSTITYSAAQTEVPSPAVQPSSSPSPWSSKSDSSENAEPEPMYPVCSRANKTRFYAADSARVDVFHMDAPVSNCSYTTSVLTGPSVGLIMPGSTGLGYIYVMPSNVSVGTTTAFSYAVKCNGEVTCEDQVKVTVAATDKRIYPLCSNASKVHSYPVGEVSTDRFPLDIQNDSCTYTSSISVGPSIGTMTPFETGLAYEFAVPSTATVGHSTAVGYTVQCNADIVCADVLMVALAPASATSAPPASSLAPTTVPPASLPACSQNTQVNTYIINSLYRGKLPLDVQETECVYTAAIHNLSVGAVVTLDPSDPLGYLYSTDNSTAPQDTSIPYTIACNSVVICQGAVFIQLTLDAAACPASTATYIVHPGAVVNGTVDSGAVCSTGAAPRASLRSAIEGLILRADGTFSFQAPLTEADVAATVLLECNGEVVCQTNVVFVVAERTVAPPTTSTAAPIPMCHKFFQYEIPISTSTTGTLDAVPTASCEIITYLLEKSNNTIRGRLVVNLRGEFQYTAPDSQGVDYAAVDVYCANSFICRTQLVFLAYIPLTTVSPLQPCANVYYYQVTPGVGAKLSLNNMPGQDACPHGRHFTLTTGPQAGTLEMEPIGDFLYRPPMQKGQFSFTFTMYCLNQPHCAGTAYLLVSHEWTLDPTPTSSSSSSPEEGTSNITNEQITCRGTCNANAWKTYPSRKVWDTTPDAGYARKDGHLVNGMTVTWRENSLVFIVYSLIGNLGVRFPTFEPITSAEKAYMEPTDFASSVAPGSTGFEMSCLAQQGRNGTGEDVWRWTGLSNASGTGGVGAYYRSGESWYQKFGGKHVGCDTFSDPCAYAPLLTPANYTNSSLGRWTIDVNDCDATWTGVFPYRSVEKMVRHDGLPVWEFVGHHQLQGTLYSESVQAHSWLKPGQFDAHYDAHNILINLNQFVSVTKTGVEESLISVDAEFFTYVDKETHDQAFGINLLLYPSVESFMATSYARDRHVKGFKWVTQEWMSLDTEQCPTCTGSKSKCSASHAGAEASYTSSSFPEGDCANGTSRVHLFKGPAMMPSECPQNPMHVFNQSGFSPTRNCKTTYQNVTLRGIVPGSSGLSEAHLRALNFEGTVQLMLLMDDNRYERLDVHLSMYVSRLSKDAHRMQGELSTCRSGSYWPVLDPLGSSLPSNPFALSVAEATPLCVDDLSSTYGLNDWALFTVNMPGVKPNEVVVRSVYVLYNNLRIYLVYRNQSTGATVIPEKDFDGVWWQHGYPFLAFRDLRDNLQNISTTFSTEMQTSAVAADVVYAFIFIPGSLGTDANIEVVVEASNESSGPAASTTEFRRVLHIDPLLTQLSRQGPPPASSSPKHEQDRMDMYAMGASAGVAVTLVMTVIFFMLADNSRPLPKWVPRGKLIKETVLSVLPAGLHRKRESKPMAHRDMYDAMNSGCY